MGPLDLTAIDKLSDALSYTIPGASFSPQFRMGNWDGKERLLGKKLTFPVGLLEKTIQVLSTMGFQTDVDDQIAYLSRTPEIPSYAISLYPYQREVVQKALDKKRGTIQVATGGGKSVIISYLVGALNVQTMIYVISLELLDQLRETVEKITGAKVGVIGGGQCRIEGITVCSVWTAGLACGEKIERSEEDEDASKDSWSPTELQREQIREAVGRAKVAILDESQFAAATTIRMILRHSKSAAYRYGFSATPWRTEGDDILLEAAFGETICKISGTDLIQKGYLVRPKIVFRDIPKLPKIPKKWPAVKANYIVANQERNEVLVKNAVKLFEMGRKPLMLFRDIKHGEILHSMMPSHLRCELISGESSVAQRRSLKERFAQNQIDIIISSSILDQGFDLPALDALVLCGGGKSTAKALQRIGRVLRTSPESGKKDAIVVDTFDQSHYVTGHSYERYKIYKSEPAFVVKTDDAMNEYIRKQEWASL